MKNILIIGFGKAGSHLYYALKKVRKYKTDSFELRRFRKQVDDADIIFITAQDSKISIVVHDTLKLKLNFKNKFVYHVSGSLTSDELKGFQKAGAVTGSFHPVQTFESVTNKDKGRFKNIYIALEGLTKATKQGKEIAVALGAKSFVLSKKDKVLHHINCVFSSGFLVSHLSGLSEFRSNKKGHKIGFNNRSFFSIYRPLAEQTLANIANKGLKKSLTGPFERNDLATIKKHLIALKKTKLLNYYKELGTISAQIALNKKSIDRNAYNLIIKLLKKS